MVQRTELFGKTRGHLENNNNTIILVRSQLSPLLSVNTSHQKNRSDTPQQKNKTKQDNKKKSQQIIHHTIAHLAPWAGSSSGSSLLTTRLWSPPAMRYIAAPGQPPAIEITCDR